MVKFVADSSCDMTEIEGVNFASVPLTLYSADFNFTDNAEMDVHELIDSFEKYKGRSYTACPGTDSWLQAYEGADEVYVCTLTSGLSGTYNSAMAAADIFLQEHPEAKIHVFDSLSTGPELRILVEKLIELKQSGLSFEEICEKGEAYIKTTRLFFAFCSLHNFAQNGRVSKVIASAVGVLGISIIGTASEEGDIAPQTKCRGERKVIATLILELEKCGYKGGRFRLCHVENEELAKKVTEAVKERFGTTDILFYQARGICSYYGERGGIIIGCETC